jgi:RND family efflux transporter MFP subunit
MIVGVSLESAGKTYPGTVRANEEVDLAFEVPGRLIELPVKRGDWVKPGDLLAKLDQRDYENDRDVTAASWREMQSTLERVKRLHAEGAAREKELIDSQAAFDRADAELRIREKALTDTELLAPYDGVVANRFVENFENVAAKQVVFSLQQIEVIKIEVDIPERDLAQITPDQADRNEIGRFEARFPTIGAGPYDLKIKEFITEADPVTQTFRVSLIFDAPETVTILPGMTASVTWYQPGAEAATAQRRRVLVPSVAVFDDERLDGAGVWIVDPSTMSVATRTVTLGGPAEHDSIEIIDGLESGEMIATSGVHHLREGQVVRHLYGKPGATREDAIQDEVESESESDTDTDTDTGADEA